MVALVILAFGAYFARFIGAARHGLLPQRRHPGRRLARPARACTRSSLFVVLIALEQMQIGGDIVRQTFLILLAGVVLALALAFGLGGRKRAAELLERWWKHSADARTKAARNRSKPVL